MKRWLLFQSGTANVALLAVLLVLPYALENLKSTALMASQILIFAVVGLAFNILLGYTGLLSFGHGMFLGMGMYGATLAQIHFLKGQFVLPILIGTALAALTGATFLVWADTAARTVFAPRELPVGIVTAFLGAPVFALLLWQRRSAAGDVA